jgi:catechol 2,3-dioxygenase-like lactoylglutathione lyase family enzyme
MLSKEKLKAFIPTVEPEKAKEFYMNVLGLQLVSEDNFALEFDSNGIRLRVTKVGKFIPYPFTVLGWDTEDIATSVQKLREKGVIFEKYDFLEQDDLAIWTAPGGTKVTWFKDPDGNLLSLSE